MVKYSEEFKISIMKQMMPPQNKSIAEVSKETGISQSTLVGWRKKAKAKGIPITSGKRETEGWSTQDKFSIVVETATLSEAELAEYCRKKGLYVEQVQAWKDACMQANGGVAEEASRAQKELRLKERKIKDLSQELKRKESALAETAALLVLRKKVNAIWGENEDE